MKIILELMGMVSIVLVFIFGCDALINKICDRVFGK